MEKYRVTIRGMGEKRYLAIFYLRISTKVTPI